MMGMGMVLQYSRFITVGQFTKYAKFIIKLCIIIGISCTINYGFHMELSKYPSIRELDSVLPDSSNLLLGLTFILSFICNIEFKMEFLEKVDQLVSIYLAHISSTSLEPGHISLLSFIIVPLVVIFKTGDPMNVIISELIIRSKYVGDYLSLTSDLLSSAILIHEEILSFLMKCFMAVSLYYSPAIIRFACDNRLYSHLNVLDQVGCYLPFCQRNALIFLIVILHYCIIPNETFIASFYITSLLNLIDPLYQAKLAEYSSTGRVDQILLIQFFPPFAYMFYQILEYFDNKLNDSDIHEVAKNSVLPVYDHKHLDVSSFKIFSANHVHNKNFSTPKYTTSKDLDLPLDLSD